MKDNITESNKQRNPRFERKRICIPVSFAIVFVLVTAEISALMSSDKPPLDELDIVRFSAESQSALDEFQRTYGFPGATAASVLKDGTTFVAASGLADVEAEQPRSLTVSFTEAWSLPQQDVTECSQSQMLPRIFLSPGENRIVV